MNTILLIIIGILLTVELGIIMFCDYWRDNNPWKWFIIKTLSTIAIVSWFLKGEEAFGMFDIIFVSILSICVGIDLTCTIINSKALKND